MYNRAYKEETFRTRTGSHSTKGSRRGYVEEWHFGIDESMLSGDATRQECLDAIVIIERLRREAYTELAPMMRVLNKKNMNYRANQLGRDLHKIINGDTKYSRREELCLSYYRLGVRKFKIQEFLKGVNKENVHRLPTLFMNAAEEILSEKTFAEILEKARQLHP